MALIENEKAKKVAKIVAACLAALVALLGTLFGFSSCNVTRVITTESSYIQRGDTTTSIIVKTRETYDATKKN